MQKNRPPGKRRVKPWEVDDGGLLKKNIEQAVRGAVSFGWKPFAEILDAVRSVKPLARSSEVVLVLKQYDQEGKVKSRFVVRDGRSIPVFRWA